MIEKRSISVAPTTSSWSIIVDASFFLTNAETPTAITKQITKNVVITEAMETKMMKIIGTLNHASCNEL